MKADVQTNTENKNKIDYQLQFVEFYLKVGCTRGILNQASSTPKERLIIAQVQIVH